MTESVIHEPGAEWLVPQDLGPGLSAPLPQLGDKTIEPSQAKPPRRISMHAIRAVALRIADRFQPEKSSFLAPTATPNRKAMWTCW
jgi:hypothetical protein